MVANCEHGLEVGLGRLKVTLCREESAAQQFFKAVETPGGQELSSGGCQGWFGCCLIPSEPPLPSRQ